MAEQTLQVTDVQDILEEDTDTVSILVLILWEEN